MFYIKDMKLFFFCLLFIGLWTNDADIDINDFLFDVIIYVIGLLFHIHLPHRSHILLYIPLSFLNVLI